MNIIDESEDLLRQINKWWDDPKYRYKVVDREDYLFQLISNSNRLIKILIGARRVGKTSIMQSHINYLLDKTDSRQIIYLPADLREIRERGVRNILESLAQIFNFKLLNKKLYVFIDEVQEIEGWQKDLKFLYDNSKIHFIITGSSSLILKNDTSKLTGRFLLQHVLPLSYKEFLKFKKKKDSPKLLNEYIHFGGYPEYVLNESLLYLQQTVESTLYRDLLDLYGIRNPIILQDMLQLLADKITTPVSANRIGKDLGIDDKTVKFYLDYLKSVYLIYPVYLYGRSNKISKSSLPKYYFNDNGVLNLFGIRQRVGHMVENAVFVELLRNQNSELTNIFYDVIDGQEVDFKVKNNLYEVKSKPINEDEILKYEKLKGKVKIITSETVQDIYVPNVELIELRDFIKGNQVEKNIYKLPASFRKKLGKIDPVKYQRKIRKEY